MQKKADRKFHPVMYFSKRTSPTEAKYHSFDLETLAVIYATRRFRVYLFGLRFKVVTDCEALTRTLLKKEINPRIARWAMELESFDYFTEHRPGSRMQHVDALSRSIAVLVIEDNPFEWSLSVCQSQDSVILEISKDLETREDKMFEMRNGAIYRKKGKDLLFYVPTNMEKNVLFRHHDEMGHPSLKFPIGFPYNPDQ